MEDKFLQKIYEIDSYLWVLYENIEEVSRVLDSSRMEQWKKNINMISNELDELIKLR